MFYLFPEKNKKDLKKELKLRILLVCLVFAGLIVVSLVVFMVPAYIAASIRAQYLDARRISLASTNASEDIKNSLAEMSGAEAKISILQPDTAGAPPSDVVGGVLSAQISAVRIQEISYSSGQGGTAAVQVSGIADERESLLSFVDNLKDQFKSAAVSLPVSSFAKDRDINFSISITGKI